MRIERVQKNIKAAKVSQSGGQAKMVQGYPGLEGVVIWK